MELESTLELAVLVSGPGVDLLQFIGTESNRQLYLGARNLYRRLFEEPNMQMHFCLSISDSVWQLL